ACRVETRLDTSSNVTQKFGAGLIKETKKPAMLLRPGLELANLSDVGLQREQNEDYFCYAEPASEEDFRRIGRLAVVADGMGGHEGGQVASGIAIDTVRDAYLTHRGDDLSEALLT